MCCVSKMGHCCYIFFPMPLLLHSLVESLFKRKGHCEIRLYKKSKFTYNVMDRRKQNV